MNRHAVPALLEEIAGTLICDLTRVNAFDSCCRPTNLLTDEERSEIRRVRDEVYELLLKDEERRRTGEGNVRDRVEVLEMAREILPSLEAGAA